MNALRDSLEHLAELGIDPGPEVYARVFARWPETERLFFRDDDGAIRAHMLFEVIEAALDWADTGHYAKGYIATERVHHVDDLQVSDAQYVGFFEVLRDAVRDGLGAAWTPAMESAWAALIVDVAA